MALTADNLERVAAGALRLRQRPGATNALGLAEFVFPNRHAVYLHGTPAPELFARERRDFSHGCIRIADPAAFAQHMHAAQIPLSGGTRWRIGVQQEGRVGEWLRPSAVLGLLCCAAQ